MSIPAVTPYETLANVKSALQIAATDTTQDALLTTLLQANSELIDRYCHRRFDTITETRDFYAPRYPILPVYDLLSVTSIVVGGQTLDTTNYELRPYALTEAQPHYTQIVRMTGTNGLPISWRYNLPAAFGHITVAGTWGYATAVPAVVQLACQIMTVRMYTRHATMYANERGESASGIGLVQSPRPVMDPDVCDLLAPPIKLPLQLQNIKMRRTDAGMGWSYGGWGW